MKILLLSFLVIGFYPIHAQRQQSSCDTAKNYAYFKEDMDQVLLQHIKLSDPTEYDNSVEIRQDSFMFYLERLSTLRNHKTVKALDTIYRGLYIHNDEKLFMREMEVVVSESLDWVINLKNKEDSSGHPLVDKYIRNYKMTYKYYDLGNGTAALIFTTGMNVNINALKKKFEAIDNAIVHPQPQSVGEVPYFEIMKMDDTTTKAILHYGFGDCQAGCISHVHWKFNIYNDCSFEYLGISGDTGAFRKLYIKLSNQGKAYNRTKAYPNPFNNVLNIENAQPGSSYDITDMNGKRLQSGLMPDDSRINTSQLSSGMYMLKVYSDGVINSMLIAKY
jgi:hypothetical protein